MRWLCATDISVQLLVMGGWSRTLVRFSTTYSIAKMNWILCCQLALMGEEYDGQVLDIRWYSKHRWRNQYVSSVRYILYKKYILLNMYCIPTTFADIQTYAV
jgi:hypothetical protein